MRALALCGLAFVLVVVSLFLWLLKRPGPPAYPEELKAYLFTERDGPGGSVWLLPVPEFDTDDVLVRDLLSQAVEAPVRESRRLALSLAREQDWPWLLPAVGEAMLQEEGGILLRDVPARLAADPGLRPYLERGLRSANRRILLDAVTGAGRMRLADEVPVLVPYLSSEDEDVRRAAGEALARIGTVQAYEPLVENYLSRGDAVIIGHTVEWISRAEEKAVGLVIDRFVAAPMRSSVRHRAMPLLRASQSPKALRRLIEDGLPSEWGRARYYAYLALVDLEDVETLRRLAHDPDSPHRAPAAWGLAVLGREDEEVVTLLQEEVEREIRAGTSQVFATPGGDHGLVIPWRSPPECHLETVAALRTETDLYEWLWGLLQVPPGGSADNIRSRILQAMAIRSPERAETQLREVLDAFDPLRDDLLAPEFLRALDGMRLLAAPTPETQTRLAELLETLPSEHGEAGFPARAVRLILYGKPPAHSAEVAAWDESEQLRYRKLFTRYRRGGGSGLWFTEAEDMAYEAIRGKTAK